LRMWAWVWPRGKCIPLTMMVVRGILRIFCLVDVKWVLNLFCTRGLLFNCRYLLAEQGSYKIGLPEGCGTASLSVWVDLPEIHWSANSDLAMHRTNHHPRWLNCDYRLIYQVGPDCLRLSENPHHPLVLIISSGTAWFA
jgi:hypothetical protein